MEMKALSKAEFQGRPFTLKYRTKGYYDIASQDDQFCLTYRTFDAEKEMSFTDCFFGEWLEDPVAFGAFHEGQLVGFVEGAHEKWNNRYRISNICVFEEAWRAKGLGSMLM